MERTKISFIIYIDREKYCIEQTIESIKKNNLLKCKIQIIVLNFLEIDMHKRISELSDNNTDIIYVDNIDKNYELNLEIINGNYICPLRVGDILEKKLINSFNEIWEQNNKDITVIKVSTRNLNELYYKSRNLIYKESRKMPIVKESLIGTRDCKFFIKKDKLLKVILKMTYNDLILGLPIHILTLENNLYAIDNRIIIKNRNSDLNKIELEKLLIEKLKIYLKHLNMVNEKREYINFELQKELIDFLKNIILIFKDSISGETIDILKELLVYVDEKVILDVKNLNDYYRLKILELKNKELKKQIYKFNQVNNIQYFFKDTQIYSLKDTLLYIDFITIEKDILTIEGYLTNLPQLEEELIYLYSKYNNVVYKAQIIENPIRNIYLGKDIIIQRNKIKLEIPLSDLKSNNIIKFYIEKDNIQIIPKISFGYYVKLYKEIQDSYFIQNGYCCIYKGNCLHIIKDSFKTRIGREFRFIKSLYKKEGIKHTALRCIGYIIKVISSNQKIMVFMDRIDKADDNAEHLFKYATTQPDEYKKYFVVNKASDDFKRLSHIGKIINYGSWKHKLLLISANFLISSHAADFVRKQFNGDGKYVRNLIDFKFIFLQHGITQNNVAKSLVKYSRNISLFITASKLEYNSIINGSYDYDTDIVKLAGFARYDNLKNKAKNTILIMPTWRRELLIKDANGKRRYNPEFVNSEYFKKWNNLMNHKELLEVLKKHGYKIIFFPHPELIDQIKDFNQNEYMKICDYGTSYQTLFKEAKILITDYSSVFFDFCYMKKPVLYYQFDKASFYENQYDRGYFDYDTMGFGKVHETEDKLINNLIQLIQNQCKMEEEYIRRVGEFFAFHDYENSKRIYKLIKEKSH